MLILGQNSQTYPLKAIQLLKGNIYHKACVASEFAVIKTCSTLPFLGMLCKRVHAWINVVTYWKNAVTWYSLSENIPFALEAMFTTIFMWNTIYRWHFWLSTFFTLNTFLTNFTTILLVLSLCFWYFQNNLLGSEYILSPFRVCISHVHFFQH